MASGTKNKNWVVQALHVNGEGLSVAKQDDGGNTMKLKVDVSESGVLRIYFPGGIQFCDQDYQESKGSRLATDMKMPKSPDEVLYSFDLKSTNENNHKSSIDITRQDDKQLLIISATSSSPSTEETPTKVLVQIASKWSLNDLLNTIERCTA